MSRARLVRAGLMLALLALPAAPRAVAEQGSVDVSVSGPTDSALGLGRQAFALTLGGRDVPLLGAEQSCALGGGEGALSQPASYLFYFDHPRLTAAGRRRGVELARGLIAELTDAAGQVTIVSNGQELETFIGFTQDRTLADQALGRMAGDPLHGRAFVDPPPTPEAEASWRMQRSLHRLGMVLERFADVRAPNVLLYFGDRSNPIWSLSSSAEDALDEAVEAAAANGVRFYIGQSGEDPTELNRLSAQTAGRAFDPQLEAEAIASQILQDLGCTYRLQFDTTGLPRDRPLSMTVEVQQEDVAVTAGKKAAFRSASRLQVSRLLSRFGSAAESVLDSPIQAHVIPTGYAAGSFTARIQIVVPGSPSSRGSWDILASFVSPGKDRQDFSGPADVPASNSPLVIEHPVEFDPGPYEIAVLARHRESDRVTSRFVSVSWPELAEGATIVGPIAVLQGPATGNGGTDDEALVARARYEPLLPGLRSAFFGIVCTRDASRGRLQIQRRVLGERSYKWPADAAMDTTALDCVVLHDFIPAGRLEAGFYRYEVRVFEETGESAEGVALASKVRVFSTSTP